MIEPHYRERQRVYTVSEVASALRVSSETIRRKIGTGELRAVEITSGPRRQYRILTRDLAAWLGRRKPASCSVSARASRR